MLNALDSRRAKCGFYRVWGDLVNRFMILKNQIEISGVLSSPLLCPNGYSRSVKHSHLVASLYNFDVIWAYPHDAQFIDRKGEIRFSNKERLKANTRKSLEKLAMCQNCIPCEGKRLG